MQSQSRIRRSKFAVVGGPYQGASKRNRRRLQITAQQVLAQILALQPPDPGAVLLGVLTVNTSRFGAAWMRSSPPADLPATFTTSSGGVRIGRPELTSCPAAAAVRAILATGLVVSEPTGSPVQDTVASGLIGPLLLLVSIPLLSLAYWRSQTCSPSSSAD
jgi:hypothetical protein